MSDRIPIGHHGWARQSENWKIIGRSLKKAPRTVVSKLKAVSPQKKQTASSDDMKRLHKHFAKG